MKVNKEKELSAQERRFCFEYLIDFNKTAAYIRAGYTSNYFSASVQATRKSQEPHIIDFIDYLKAERETRTGVTGDKVVQELAKIAFFNPRSILQVTYNEAGGVNSRLMDVSEMSPDDGAAISEITERQVHRDDDLGVTVIDRKYKFHNKTEALKELGKHTGIYEKDNSQKSVAQVVITLPTNGREVTDTAPTE